jgi:hypothetical protein
MRQVGLAFLATAAVALIGVTASASAAEIVTTPDGHYYRLVPLTGPVPGTAPEVVTVIPNEAIASVPQNSNCHIVPMSQYEYPAQYVTACGPL